MNPLYLAVMWLAMQQKWAIETKAMVSPMVDGNTAPIVCIERDKWYVSQDGGPLVPCDFSQQMSTSDHSYTFAINTAKSQQAPKPMTTSSHCPSGWQYQTDPPICVPKQAPNGPVIGGGDHQNPPCDVLYGDGEHLTEGTPRMDVPAVKYQHGTTDTCTWDCRVGYVLTCADKSRILLTAEDGTKHCIKFPK